MDQIEAAGHTVGYINFTPFLVRPAVIDTYKYKLAVAGIDEANQGTKRKVGVGGRQDFRGEDLAVGGFAPVEARTVPTGVARPGLNRPCSMTYVSYQRRFHQRSGEEHDKFPPKRTPHHTVSMSHSYALV